MRGIVEKVRTTFYIDAELHRKLNIAVVSQRPKRSMSEVVEALIRKFLDSDQDEFLKSALEKPASRIKVN